MRCGCCKHATRWGDVRCPVFERVPPSLEPRSLGRKQACSERLEARAFYCPRRDKAGRMPSVNTAMRGRAH